MTYLKWSISFSTWVLHLQTIFRSTNVNVYNTCVVSTLLYGSESWTTYSTQEYKLHVIHMRSLRRILGVSWKEKFTNSQVLTIHTLLRQRRLRWIGHVHRMEDGRIRIDLFDDELADGKRNVSRSKLRFKDVCKRDMKACNINHNTWETFAADRLKWKCVTSHGLKYGSVSDLILIGMAIT